MEFDFNASQTNIENEELQRRTCTLADVITIEYIVNVDVNDKFVNALFIRKKVRNTLLMS